MALKTRNGMVISPHPRAKECTALATKIVHDAAVAAGAPKNIIACIEDSPVIIHTLRRILVPAGFQMISIPEPMRGFTQLIEYKPDLILLDLLLPNADGYSICNFLRNTPVFAKTPIIILTAQNTLVDRSQAISKGANGFLVKPPQAAELLQIVEKFLEP